MPGGAAVMVYREGSFKCSLNLSPKVLDVSYILITEKLPTLVPVDGPTFVFHSVLVLGRNQDVLKGSVTPKVGLYAILTADLDAFTWALGVRYDNVTNGLGFSSGGLSTNGVLVSGIVAPLTGKQ